MFSSFLSHTSVAQDECSECLCWESEHEEKERRNSPYYLVNLQLDFGILRYQTDWLRDPVL